MVLLVRGNSGQIEERHKNLSSSHIEVDEVSMHYEKIIINSTTIKDNRTSRIIHVLLPTARWDYKQSSRD